MRQRLRLNAVRKNGFVVTVSIRPLNVASFNSLRDFCHQPGTRPQHIGSKTRLPPPERTVSTMVVGQTFYRGRILVGGFAAVSS